QAIAGILGGLQSMHTDGFDEALACPTEHSARIAVATQNILREEAHLCDVIDPLGGSWYVETLTNEMEEKILAVMKVIEDAGGMYAAVDAGIVQRMLGKSALAHQNRIESGEEKIVGVNCYQVEDERIEVDTYRPDRAAMEAQVAAFREYKAARDQGVVRKALGDLARAANNDENVYEKVVHAAWDGVTHGEIVACLRRELGFGHPQMVA
ncbi:MAG: methylmalonyl-CoA mutase family protein, partial [Pseudomonadota bacterium]